MLHTRSSTSTLIILTLLTCSLAACKAKELPDEPYTAVDYNLYPAPQDAYVGDTMPFVTTARSSSITSMTRITMAWDITPSTNIPPRTCVPMKITGRFWILANCRIPTPRSAPAPSCRIRTASTTFSTPGITTPETAARARNA